MFSVGLDPVGDYIESWQGGVRYAGLLIEVEGMCAVNVS